MSSFKEQALAFFFSIISLETLMGIYNTFHTIYISLENKFQQSFQALSPIWWTEADPNYYTTSLKDVTWLHSPHKNLLWNRSQPDGVETTLKTIPWLSAELYYGDTKLADLSHWIMELHYRDWSGCVAPSVDVIFQAWAATHGHRIHYADLGGYRIDVIDENAEDHTYRLGEAMI